MKVFVFGASNSLMRAGWVSALSRERGDVVNRSVGAVTSHMAIFRLLTCSEIRAGDVAVWEYAINDGNARVGGHGSEAELLAHVERFLIEARRLGVRVAPLLFPSRDWSPDDAAMAHVAALEGLFRAYGVAPSNLMARFMKVYGAPNPRRLFMDPFHISPLPGPMGHVIDGAREAIEMAALPDDRPRLYTRPERLAVQTGSPTGASIRYKNSVMDIDVAHGPTRWDFTQPGRLLSAYLVASPRRYELTFSLRQGSTALMTRRNFASTIKFKRLLRGVSFLSEPAFAAGATLDATFKRTPIRSWSQSIRAARLLTKQDDWGFDPLFAGLLTAHDEEVS